MSTEVRTGGAARRAFLRFIATSPLWATAASSGALGKTLLKSSGTSVEGGVDFPDQQRVIESVDEALNVFDLQAVARQKLPPAHYGQIASAAGSGRIMDRNREGFEFYGIEARRMVGVERIDPSVTLFGARSSHPILLSPAGSHKIANPEGEVATARGAAERDAPMILSTFTSTAIEDVARARGKPVWYQLYPNTDWNVTRGLVKRAEAAGSPAIVCTVDGLGGAAREVFERWRRLDTRDCTTCHTETASGERDPFKTAPMFAGLNTAGTGQLGPAINWEFIARLRDATDRKLLIKGILNAEDADRAIQAGADGIFVSNHGGRQFDSGISTIEVLAEIAAAVKGRVPVIIDSGFRRGTDVFKALGLGATAVGIGRPYFWGLAAFGAPGVAMALRLMQTEFEVAMRHAGALSTAQITPKMIRRL
jgi:isopentenyl diphosphate isomerase/L-lactate dehydrogenase-like FMN-dependent dehydrogenase